MISIVLGTTFLFILFFGLIAKSNNIELGVTAMWAIGITGAASAIGIGLTKD
ncbi:MAG: hypothetical protein ACD_12C00174G0002 [uncultured bacterium]|nr:MAG: hypothetical protein ACD_12C00174G0002 [uncultured bacterium]